MKNQYLARLLLLKKSYKFMNKTSLKKIMVIGSGAWGTALANHIAINNHSVFLNSIESDVIDEINNKNSNSKYLKNIKLHKNLSAGFEYISDADFVFLVVPSDVANTVFNKIAKTKFKKNCFSIYSQFNIMLQINRTIVFLQEKIASFFVSSKTNDYNEHLLETPSINVDIVQLTKPYDPIIITPRVLNYDDWYAAVNNC